MKTRRLTNLSEDTIRTKTSTGNTRLHMAAEAGQIRYIPRCLLVVELFLDKNNRGQTPLHLAASHGHLDQVPRAFLTEQTLTTFNGDGKTVLHLAAEARCMDQIPKEFLTSKLLSLRAKDCDARTVFHCAAASYSVKQIPREAITREMWKARDNDGRTPEESFRFAAASWYQRSRNIPFLTSNCHTCLGGIEFSENGLGHMANCPHCEHRTRLGPAEHLGTRLNTDQPITVRKCDPPPKQVPPPPENKTKPVPLAKLTVETIRSSTKRGDTPLHRAARNCKISEVPSQLLQMDLFLAKNSEGRTPLHVAAEAGCLNQIPNEFLTKQTLTVRTGPPYAPEGFYTTGSGYKARTETVLHIAVRCGHSDQIPRELLTPEFLSIEATGYRLTLLHELALAGRLDLVPESYVSSEMWNLRDNLDRKPRDLVYDGKQRQASVAAVREEPATEKQKEKLRWFGCTWNEGITKGQASDALDQCVRQFPDRNADYYSRPATEEQKAKIRSFGMNAEDNRRDGPLTYGEAKDLIRDVERNG